MQKILYIILIICILFVFYTLFMKRNKCKVVIFDLDETLGYFSELGLFWDGLEDYTDIKLDNLDMRALLDTYPEFIRPNIMAILNYLKILKTKGTCHKVMIYTNNQGPRQWALSIKDYFEYKLNYPLFDKVISAFKIGNEIIEPKRTTHNKTVNDFFNCSKLPINSQLCFIDDQFHPEMVGDNVYYIYLKPYKYGLFPDEMIDRFDNCLLKKYVKGDYNKFRKYMLNHMKSNSYEYKTDEELEIDRLVSKKIIENLQNFFSDCSKNCTKKRKN